MDEFLADPIFNNINIDVDYICKLMVETFKITSLFFSISGNKTIGYNYGSSSLFTKNSEELYKSIFDVNCLNDDVSTKSVVPSSNQNEATITPVIKSTEYLENYLCVNLIENNYLKGIFVIGPSIFTQMSNEKITTIIEENKIPISQKKLVLDYYNSLTVIDINRLVGAGLSLCYMLYKKKLSISEVIIKDSHINKKLSDINHSFDINLSRNKQNIHFHHSQLLEKNICSCIKAGNSKQILILMQEPPDGQLGILSKKDHLRGQKNLAICLVAIFTRAAIDGGIDSETAYTLSDMYIQTIESVNTLLDVYSLMAKIACDFADRVHKTKINRYKPSTCKCVDYISKHIYDDISLTRLASLVSLNPNYLSEQLKKELGMSLTSYVQNERIEEAKRLLAFTSSTITEISALLVFHDQSHFTRVFKKLTGKTPKSYRNENMIVNN